MLKDILFHTANAVVGPAERIEGARQYLGRGLSTQDMLALIAVGCIASGFIILIISAYIKQRNKMK